MHQIDIQTLSTNLYSIDNNALFSPEAQKYIRELVMEIVQELETHKEDIRREMEITGGLYDEKINRRW